MSNNYDSRHGGSTFQRAVAGDDHLNPNTPDPNRQQLQPADSRNGRYQSGASAANRSGDATSVDVAGEGSLPGLNMRARGRRLITMPLKSVFLGKRSVSDTSGSISSLDGSQSDRNYLGHSSHSDEQEYETTVTNIDRRLHDTSTMESINEVGGGNAQTSIGGDLSVSEQRRSKMTYTRHFSDGTRKLFESREDAGKIVDHQSSRGGSATTNDQYGNLIKEETKQYSSLNEKEATARRERVSAPAATARDQFESRLQAKANEYSAPTENTAAAHGEKVNATDFAAKEKNEVRLREKLESGNKDTEPMKHSPSTENTAAAHHGTTIGAHPSAHDRFEYRLREKLEKDNNDTKPLKHSPSMKSAAASHHGSVVSAHPSAHDRFEYRLREKMEKDNNDNKPTKHSPSMKSAAAAHHGSAVGAHPSAHDRFEYRLREKMEKDNNDNEPMKSYASMKSAPAAHHGSAVGAHPSAHDRFEYRLREKMEKDNNDTKPMKHSPSVKSATAAHHETAVGAHASANDRFEYRLREKMEKDNNDNKPMKPSASMKSAAAAHHGCAVGAHPSAHDRFEYRLREKMEKDNNDTKPMKHSPSVKSEDAAHHGSAVGAHASANDRFEYRLREKMEKDNNDNKPTIHSPSMGKTAATHHGPAVGAHPSANDRFEYRLREKMEKETLKRSYSMEVDFIEKCADQGKCNKILQYLHDNPRSSPALVTLALENIGNSLSLAHGIFESPNSSREDQKLNDNWVNILTIAVMTNHAADSTVQLAALRAIWSIVALNSQYAAEFAFRGNGLVVLDTSMKRYRHEKQIQEYGAGIASCLSSDKNQAMLLLCSRNGTMVERLVDALYFNSCSALNALFRLLVASQQSEMSPDNLIGAIGNCTNQRGGGDILSNATDTIFGVIYDCPKHTGVQIWGCRLLSALFSDERLLTSSVTESQHNSISALISNVLDHLEVILSSENPRAVHESAICLLSRISDCSDDLLAGKEEAFSRVVDGIILAQPKSRTVAMHGCHCISNVLHIRENTSTVLSSIMADFEDEEVANIAMNSVATLTKMGFQHTLTLLQSNDTLISSIVGCMNRHSKSSSIQIAGCEILSDIALDRHLMNEVCSCGGASRIISILYNLSEDSKAVCKAFRALSIIIGTCDPLILRNSSAPKSVLRAMETNPTDICIQVRGATTLWNLGSRHSTLQREIIELGGIPTITKAMRNFIASKQMQEKGIIALWSLTVPSLLERAVTSRAIEAIADAIAAHITTVKICEHGLGALSTLATSKSMVNDVENVIDMLFSCMWVNSDNANIQQGALAALSKISIDQQSHQVLKITPADLDVVINSMRSHILVKGVQENALILIRSYTFSPANVNVIGQSPYLLGLIKTAMSNFQGSFRVDVQDLLHLLPSDNQ